jgi:hypothetical protein
MLHCVPENNNNGSNSLLRLLAINARARGLSAFSNQEAAVKFILHHLHIYARNLLAARILHK